MTSLNCRTAAVLWRRLLRPSARTPVSLNSLRDRIVRDYPAALREIVLEGAARTADYQDIAYATLFLNRLDNVLAADRAAGGDFSTARETARYLALWMSYEDVIRVAQIKTRLSRVERVKAGSGGKPEQQPVVVTEFLKPGLDEFCSIMPAFRRASAARLGRSHRTPRQLQCGSAYPHQHDLRICAVARDGRDEVLAPARPSLRCRAANDRTLAQGDAGGAGARSGFAREVAECAQLIKGYSDTHRRGQGNFLKLMDTVVDPALAAPNGQCRTTTPTRRRRSPPHARRRSPTRKAMHSA